MNGYGDGRLIYSRSSISKVEVLNILFSDPRYMYVEARASVALVLFYLFARIVE